MIEELRACISRQRRRRAAALVCVLGGIAAVATPALASFHFMVIQEIFIGPPGDALLPPGTPANDLAQYVMLRMTSAGQTFTNGTFLRVEDASGNILGRFGTLTSVGRGTPCAYPNCPSIIVGTTEADTLFTFAFDVDADTGAQAATRVGLPRVGGRVCFLLGTSVVDCVAWGSFACTPANCPAGPNSLHPGESSANLCDTNFGTPAAPGGLQYGRALARSGAFSCPVKDNATNYPSSPLPFPRPENNAGTNNNVDTDIDGLINVLDCEPANPTLLWRAIEVTGQTVTGGATSTDSWSSQVATAGAGVTYDEVRGTLSQLAGFTDDFCLNPNTASTSTMDASVPPAGDGYYYVVRAGPGPNCVGTYGSGLGAPARDPLLSSCP